MNTWYLFSLAALFLMGTQRFLYKVSAERRCNTAWTTFSFMATVCCISSFLFIFSHRSVMNPGILLLVGLVNSASFSLGTITHIEALKLVPAGIVYPVVRMNAALVVIFSILFFKDRLSPFQIAGIVLALFVILVVTRGMARGKLAHIDSKKGLLLTFASLVFGAVASISSKFAAIYTDELAFMAVTYFMGMFFSLGFRKRLAVGKPPLSRADAWIVGFLMGVINFGGFYCFLKALSLGALSVVIPIVGMHFIFGIVLSALIYKEKLTPERILGISLAVVSVVLLRL